MQIKKLELKDTFEIVPRIIKDSRGFFSETYSNQAFVDNNLQTKWVQENQSLTAKAGTIRGLHFQVPPFAQAKLVRVPHGKIFDVVVDLRGDSPTYGKWTSLEISAGLCNAIYISHGFAHGYCTLENNTVVQYKVDNTYSPNHEQGIIWNDPDLNVDWPTISPIISEKDKSLPLFRDISEAFE
ncbi:MAG: dTDP-4-dehydrorhamnose 3,5-epimerase [Pyrinomonadaceae bacterium]|nr:dTDP-4-dehydrorhamnose 3,5-epimerase [Pyrinomonadaceae bacterium]